MRTVPLHVDVSPRNFHDMLFRTRGRRSVARVGRLVGIDTNAPGPVSDKVTAAIDRVRAALDAEQALRQSQEPAADRRPDEAAAARPSSPGSVHVNARLPADLMGRVDTLGGAAGRTAGLRVAAAVGVATVDRVGAAVATAASTQPDAAPPAALTPRIRRLLTDDPDEAAAIDAQLERQRRDHERFGKARAELARKRAALSYLVSLTLWDLGRPIYFRHIWREIKTMLPSNPTVLDPAWSELELTSLLSSVVRARVADQTLIRVPDGTGRIQYAANDAQKAEARERMMRRHLHATLVDIPLSAADEDLLVRVRPWVRRHGRMTTAVLSAEWEIDPARAWRLLRELTLNGELVVVSHSEWKVVRER